MLKGIGIFHFGNPDKTARISSLSRSLTEASNSKSLDDCLIVLPEAFNIRGSYLDKPLPRPLDLSIPDLLMKLSVEFKVAFVTGLIVDGGARHKYSCAYLIDGTLCKRLSCKGGNDNTSNYDPCTADYDRPRVHRGVCLSALICMDAGISDVAGRGEQLLERIRGYGSEHAVLCVPAETHSFDTERIAERWAGNLHVVIANANDSRPSVIQMKTPSRLVVVNKVNENCVEIAPLDS